MTLTTFQLFGYIAFALVVGVMLGFVGCAFLRYTDEDDNENLGI